MTPQHLESSLTHLARTTLLVLSALIGTATVAGAQEQGHSAQAVQIDLLAFGEWVRPGDEIRLNTTYAVGPLTGWMAAASEDSLTIRVEGRQFLSVPFASVEELEVKRKGASALGTVVGVVVGAGAGVALALNYAKQDCSEEFLSDLCEAGNVTAYLMPVVLAVGGGFLGRAIGGAVKPDSWESVPLRQLTLSASAHGGLGISLRATLVTGR